MIQSIKTSPQAQVKNQLNLQKSAFHKKHACLMRYHYATLLIICTKMEQSLVDNLPQKSSRTPCPTYLVKLMARGKIPFKATVKPEEKMSIKFADGLREYTLTGKLSAVWHHSPNEGKRHPITGLIMRAMGMLPGVADYTFTWRGGSGHIELKTAKNTQSDYQKDYEKWCEAKGVHYEVCRTPTEGFNVLKNWGVLDKSIEYKDLT